MREHDETKKAGRLFGRFEVDQMVLRGFSPRLIARSYRSATARHALKLGLLTTRFGLDTATHPADDDIREFCEAWQQGAIERLEELDRELNGRH